jgi:ribonucleoside-diphosphate reductase alpha chain
MENNSFFIKLIDRRNCEVKLSLDKIAQRIEEIASLMNLTKDINYMEILTHVITNLANGIKTSKVDEIIVKESIGKSVENEAYYTLGGAVAVSNLQKNVFVKRAVNVMSRDYGYADILLAFMKPVIYTKTRNNSINGNYQWADYEKRRKLKHESYVEKEEAHRVNSLIHPKWEEFVRMHREQINEAIDYKKDFRIDYFGIETLIKGYLLKENGICVETPGEMYMRIAIQCYSKLGIDTVIDAYNYLSDHAYTHATPTMSNAMTHCGQLASCFLLDHVDDSIDGMYGNDNGTVGTITKMAQISKNSGGIGVAMHDIRSSGAHVRTTNGKTSGLAPYVRVMNILARQIDQGGKRPGAIAIYLTPIHPDFIQVIQLKQQKGTSTDQATNLFYGMWIPDEFMRRIRKAFDPNTLESEKNKITWCTFDYDEHPLIYNLYGDEFTQEYNYLESMEKYKTRMPILDVWNVITRTLRMTSMPYVLFSDACNQKSNQKNLGYIKCSNLCAEIVEYSSADETAVCNLASISLPHFVEVNQTTGKKFFNHEKLHKVAKFATIGLDCVIDENKYPTECGKNSNMRHRPIGLGIQGLVDVYMALMLPYESPEAFALNALIHETIYHAAVSASVDLAKLHGPYSTYAGSPISEGKFQFDLWESETTFSGKYDWQELRNEVLAHGVRNSLLVALMPTASTSQIMGNTESFECLAGNIYRRETGAGHFLVFNKYLRPVLKKYNKDNIETATSILLNNGSVSHLNFLSEHEKRVFRTAWEIKQRAVIDQSADRGHFVCQSQSMNLYVAVPDQQIITSMLIHSWEKGLKTGSYYIRSKNAADENQVLGLNIENAVKTAQPVQKITNADTDDNADGPVCTMKDGCISCGS